MSRGLEQFVDRALVWSPAQPLFHWRNAANLVVLAYHDVADVPTFEQQIAFINESMRPVSLDAALAGLAGVRRLPPRAVLVTFDDGHTSVYTHAMPVLQRHATPAVVFAVPGVIGTSQPFWWNEVVALVERGGRLWGRASHDAPSYVRILKTLRDRDRRAAIDQLRDSAGGAPVRTAQLTVEQLRAMAEHGITVGNHTLTHPCLDRCVDDVAQAEVADAHDMLTQMLGTPPRVFAYPNGNADPRIEPLLARLGYAAAFLFDHQVAGLPAADRFRVSRVRVNSTDSLNRFRLVVSGLHPRVHAAMG